MALLAGTTRNKYRNNDDGFSKCVANTRSHLGKDICCHFVGKDLDKLYLENNYMFSLLLQVKKYFVLLKVTFLNVLLSCFVVKR